MADGLVKYDQELLVYLNSLGSEIFDPFWILITTIEHWIPLFLLIVYLIFKKHPKNEALKIAITYTLLIISVLLFTELVKINVSRLRPSNDPEILGLIRIVTPASNFSFFSGHSASSFSLTVVSVLFFRKKTKWIWLLFIWPILFAYSRIYVGAHYPLDILVGGTVGSLMAFLFYSGYRKVVA